MSLQLTQPDKPRLQTTLPDGTPYIMYEPHDKQLLFHESDISKLIAIGSRGSGKSVTLRMDAHMRLLANPGCNAILIRKTYKDLIKSHVYFQGLPWSSLKAEMKLLGGTYNATDYICHYPNGSKLFLSYVGHETDALNLLSAEFIAAYFDEISTIPWEFFLMLCASVRTSKASGIKTVIRGATNPLGESATEVNTHFVTQDVDYDEEPDYNPAEWGHIRMDKEDNPHLDVVQYTKDLMGLNLPEHVKRAWVYGEFSDSDALFSFYPNKDSKPYHVITDLDIDQVIKAGNIYRVFDMGYHPDPAYCAWIAHLGNRFIVFHEKVWFKTIIPDIASEIKQIDESLGIKRVVATYCDPTMDTHTGMDTRTMKDLFEYNGVPMENSINNREQFAHAVHAALAEEAMPGVPRLQIYRGSRYSGAPYLVKAIPLMKYNPKRPLAMDDHKHDHPVVSLAYFLISHAADDRHSLRQRNMPRWMKPKSGDSNTWVLGKDNVR